MEDGTTARSVKKTGGSSSIGKRVGARADATAAVRKQVRPACATPTCAFPGCCAKGPATAVRVTYLVAMNYLRAWQLINSKRRKNAEGDAPGAAALSGAEVAALVARCKAGLERPTQKRSHSPGRRPRNRDRSGRILVRVELIGAPGPGSGAAEGLAALRDLRKALASEDELVAQHAIDAGTIELLQAVLQGTCVDSQLEAAWCVTNIAAGSSAHTEAEILTSQYLVTFNQ